MRVRWFWIGLILLSSCSAPRYTYYFDHQHGPGKEFIATTPRIIPAPDLDDLTTSTDKVLGGTAISKQLKRSRSSQPHIREPHWDAARVTNKHRDIFLQSTSLNSGGVEPDLKRSIIFGIAGIVALIIGGQLFWVLGSLSLLIGLIFGIKWFLRK